MAVGNSEGDRNMLDLNLPWQINLLLLDAVVSFVAGLILIEKRIVRISPTNVLLMEIWNIGCLVLILWGGSLTWQHIVYTLFTVWAVYKGGMRMHQGGRLYSEKVEPNILAGKVPGGTFILGVITLVTIYLLIGGVS